MPDLSSEHQRLIETMEEYATVYGPERDGEHGRIFREATRALALKLARLEMLERGAADFLDVAERVRGGDPSLSPEAWYAERDYMRALLAAREEETA